MKLHSHKAAAFLLGACLSGFGALTGCAPGEDGATAGSETNALLGLNPDAGPVVEEDLVDRGRRNFNHRLQGGNGRACATCHIASEAFTISPETIEARFHQNPNDPIFRSIDADDFGRDFTTLRRHALFRVRLPLPANIVDLDHPEQRHIDVWRATPSTFNLRFTAPYLFDGRAANLQEQALGAVNGHFEPTRQPSQAFLDSVAAFQLTLFSSPQMEAAANVPPSVVPQDADPPLNSLEQQGKLVFIAANCHACHSGAARNQRTDEASDLELIDDEPHPLLRDFFSTNASEFNRNNLPVHRLQVTEASPTGPTVTTVVSPDPGRMLITGRARDANRFAITPLRGLARTAPYFHDHSARTLEDVVRHYNTPEARIKTFVNEVPEALIPALVAYLRAI